MTRPQAFDPSLPHAEIGCAPGFGDIFLHYSDAKGARTRRTVQPIGLRSLNDDMTGLVANCRLREEVRTFSIDRVIDASGLEAPCRTIDLEAAFARDLRRLADHRACRRMAEDLPSPDTGTCPAAPALLREIDRYISSLADGTEPGEVPEVTVSLEWPEAGPVAIHVDAPRWTMAMANRGSAHARLAHIARRQGIVVAARRLAARLEPGHPAATLRVFSAGPRSGIGWR